MKLTNPWIDRRVEKVRVPQVLAYLRGRGWEPKPFPRPQVLLFTGPPDDDGRPIVQMVPADEQGGDYLQCIIDLITNLAVIEDRPAVEVLDDILRQADRARPNGAVPGKPGAAKAAGR